ncbi:peptidylprolyl isomerase [Lentibacillus sediminis]|uniref:peptidylprolyl isomerase n=1 Tax=Lentibacillus sediminis TaxID=1940529 RepID=UPI000C1B8011|nr:peptidylprolyl isomerase [Lentibacillus sediminis]
MKKLAIAVTLSASVFGLAACNSGDGEVVVETSAENVTKEEFYEALKDSQVAPQVLTQLVADKVLAANYEVSDEEVEAELQRSKDQLGDNFQAALEQAGFTGDNAEEQYKEVLRSSLLQEKAVTEDIEVPEEDIQQRYDRMQTEIQASHILVSDEETANEVKSQLEDGADFAELAAEYSTDGSAQNGGELGYFSAGDMVSSFENAAYSLDVGEVSDPVQSQHGFHIIKVTDKRETEEELGSYEEMKDQIRRQLAAQQVDPMQAQQKITQLIQDAEVDVQIEQYEDLFAPAPAPTQPGSGGSQGEGGNSGSGEGSGNSEGESGDSGSEEDSGSAKGESETESQE